MNIKRRIDNEIGDMMFVVFIVILSTFEAYDYLKSKATGKEWRPRIERQYEVNE
jgi:hypothetical protein